LGLAVAKKIVQQHHGFIQVKSQENKGTTFVIGLPLA
jgi:two-component system sensor histidine kinase VicK